MTRHTTRRAGRPTHENDFANVRVRGGAHALAQPRRGLHGANWQTTRPRRAPPQSREARRVPRGRVGRNVDEEGAHGARGRVGPNVHATALVQHGRPVAALEHGDAVRVARRLRDGIVHNGAERGAVGRVVGHDGRLLFYGFGACANAVAAKAVEGTALTLEGVDDVHRRDRLAPTVLGVGHRVAQHVLEEDLEDAAGLLVQETRDALHAAAAGEAADGRLGDALDGVAIGHAAPWTGRHCEHRAAHAALGCSRRSKDAGHLGLLLPTAQRKTDSASRNSLQEHLAHTGHAFRMRRAHTHTPRPRAEASTEHLLR